MIIEDDARAAEYLRRIGYYRLSAYWHPMRCRNADDKMIVRDDFVPGSTFKEVTDLYTFDSRLRLITIDALERLEVSLRTAVALVLGRHGGKAYRELSTFGPAFRRQPRPGGPTRHQSWLTHVDRRLDQSRDRFAEHFRTNYPGDRMPIWIAIELFDFGPLSQLIKGMIFSDTQTVGDGYGGIRPQQVETWAHSMAFTRNSCAHHARLWNKPLINQPSLSGRGVPPELEHILQAPGATTRYYAIACVMRYMLQFANPRTTWKDRFTAHIRSFPTSERLQLSSAGFPEGWESEPLWTSP